MFSYFLLTNNYLPPLEQTIFQSNFLCHIQEHNIQLINLETQRQAEVTLMPVHIEHLTWSIATPMEQIHVYKS